MVRVQQGVVREGRVPVRGILIGSCWVNWQMCQWHASHIGHQGALGNNAIYPNKALHEGVVSQLGQARVEQNKCNWTQVMLQNQLCWAAEQLVVGLVAEMVPIGTRLPILVSEHLRSMCCMGTSGIYTYTYPAWCFICGCLLCARLSDDQKMRN